MDVVFFSFSSVRLNWNFFFWKRIGKYDRKKIWENFSKKNFHILIMMKSLKQNLDKIIWLKMEINLHLGVFLWIWPFHCWILWYPVIIRWKKKSYLDNKNWIMYLNSIFFFLAIFWENSFSENLLILFFHYQ